MKIDSVQWPVYKGQLISSGYDKNGYLIIYNDENVHKKHYEDLMEYYKHPDFTKIENILGKLNHNMGIMLYPNDMCSRHRNKSYFNIGQSDWIVIHDDNTLEFMRDKDYRYQYGDEMAII